MGVKVKKDETRAVFTSIKSMLATKILVGVTQETAPRDPEPGERGPQPSNAQIGMWMEFGVPSKNIPARAFLVPGVRENFGKTTKRMMLAGQYAIEGAFDKARMEYEAVGLEAQASVQQKIYDGPFEALAPATIAARARRGRKGAVQYMAMPRAGQTPDQSLVKPLLDTGKLYQSITYVLRMKH